MEAPKGRNVKEVSRSMKFRKMASVLLAASLMIGCAAAENRTIFKSMSEEESMANEALPVEERKENFSPERLLSMNSSVAILMQEQTSRLYSLYTWQPGQQEMTLVASNIYRAGSYAMLEDLQDRLDSLKEGLRAGTELPDAAHCFSMIVTDGEQIYGINHLTGGIFTISSDNGKPVYTDVATMQDTKFFIQEEEDYSYAMLPDTVAASGDTVLMLLTTWNDEGRVANLYAVSLKGGSVRKVNVENVRNFCAYKDGKFLLIASVKQNDYDDNGNFIPQMAMVYDPATDTTTMLSSAIAVKEDMSYQQIVYSEKLDALLYCDSTQIMGTTNFQKATLYAYIPVDGYRIAIVGDTVVAADYSSGVFARTLTENYQPNHVIHLSGTSVWGGIRDYAVDYPEVAVVGDSDIDSASAEEVARAFAAGDDAPDVMDSYVNSYTSRDAAGGFAIERLNQKGYCKDLSVYPAVKEFVESLNPVFRDFVTDKDGKIFALPVSVSGVYAFTINPTVFEEMGLTMDDIPTNFIDLCAFVTRWNDEFVEDYPNFAPVDSTEKYKDRMFRLALREWKGYCQATGQDLHFDDPIFREMVAAIDAMRCDRIEESNKHTSDEESDYKQPLIFTGTWMLDAYYDGDVTFGEDKTPKLIQMTLTKDTGFYLGQGIEMELMFVNPRTTDSDEIGTMLEYVIKNISDANKVEMVTGWTTPIENPWYEEERKQDEADLAMYQKMYDEAPEEEKADYKQMLDDWKTYMEQSAESNRYTVSPAYIQRYQDVILPALYIGKPTVLDSTDNTSGLRTLVQRYIDGQITIDQFIREADGKLRMIQMENQ